MRLTLAVDPGMSGGYAVSFDGLKQVELYPWTDETEWLEYLSWLANHEDASSLTAVVELVPPFAGKMIPSSTSFKLGDCYGFIRGSIRANKIPMELVRPQAWQKGLPGLQGLKGQPRKKALRDQASRLFPNTKGLTLKTCDALLILRHHLSLTN